MPIPYQPRDPRAEHEQRAAMMAAFRAAKAALFTTTR